MFYIKLALNNLKQSFSHFAPFFLVSITTFIFCTITILLGTNPSAGSMGTGVYALGLASIVLVILSGILCLYSFNFLLKQRNQEFGLYNILGMNKRQIIWVSTIELFVIYLITVVLGSILSAVFANLFYLIFVNLIQYDGLNFQLTAPSFIATILIFAVIFSILEFVSIIKISKTSALNLFSNQKHGEREPRGNIFLAFIGILSTGYGYYLSVTAGSVSAFMGITRFFIAILAVIFGTYLFYISFIAWYLKRRRKNKNYFYKPNHFITVSQMIFRMKQNAVGLANITLLAIMAFVTVFSSVALYSGNDAIVNMAFPKNTKIELKSISNRQQAQEIFQNQILSPLREAGYDDEEKFFSYLDISYSVYYKQQKTKEIVVNADSVVGMSMGGLDSQAGIMEVMTQDDFRSLGNELPHLNAGEVAFYSYDTVGIIPEFDKISWFGQEYKKVYQISSLKNMIMMNSAIPAGVLVVPDDETMEAMRQPYDETTPYSYTYSYQIFANLEKGENQVLQQRADANSGVLYAEGNQDGVVALYSTEEEFRLEALQLTGGFLFTGFLLGIAFLLGAALIIYYKQLSEGTQDKQSYRILQEVGMSLKQVKKTINSQIILVFFLPLAIAILHFIFALPILKKLLLLFGVQGDRFLYMISAGTIAGILLIYYLIYKITSRTYYKIIER